MGVGEGEGDKTNRSRVLFRRGGRVFPGSDQRNLPLKYIAR